MNFCFITLEYKHFTNSTKRTLGILRESIHSFSTESRTVVIEEVSVRRMVRVLEGTGVEVTQVALPVGSDQSTWAMVEDILAGAIKPDDIQNRVNLPGRETRIVRWVTLRGTGLLHVYIKKSRSVRRNTPRQLLSIACAVISWDPLSLTGPHL
jgi:hypothetical protein